MEKMVFELTLDTNFWGSPVGEKNGKQRAQNILGGCPAVIMKTLLIKKLEDDFVKLLKLSIYTY